MFNSFLILEIEGASLEHFIRLLSMIERSSLLQGYQMIATLYIMNDLDVVVSSPENLFLGTLCWRNFYLILLSEWIISF